MTAGIGNFNITLCLRANTFRMKIRLSVGANLHYYESISFEMARVQRLTKLLRLLLICLLLYESLKAVSDW